MSSFPSEHLPTKNVLASRVLQASKEHGLKLYLVGGYVRDALLGRVHPDKPKDFDFMVMGGSAINFVRAMADALDGYYVLLDEKQDTARLVTQSGPIFDFAACVGGSLLTDAQRRDFTVNALMWDAETPETVIDLVGGLADLQKKTIRCREPQLLHDDPLRMLRAFRFAASLQFSIDQSLLSWIEELKSLIHTAAGERISYELLRMFEARPVFPVLQKMVACGLLEELFPELQKTRQVPRNSYHHLALFEHCLETVRQCEVLYEAADEQLRHWLQKELAQGFSRLAALKLSCLLHDIGKPATWAVTPDGKHTFIGHDRVGAEMSRPIAGRLHWSRPLARYVHRMILWHLRPGHLIRSAEATPKAYTRFFRTVADETNDLIMLALADFHSTCGDGLQEGREEFEQKIRELLSSYSVFKKETTNRPRLLDGKEIMNILGIERGPLVGEILDELTIAQDTHEIKTKAEAKKYIVDLYSMRFNK